jgi:phosphonopyruvate decarboxylase
MTTELRRSPEHQPIKEPELYRNLKSVFNFNFVTGLPCGELKHFIQETNQDSEILHLQATNEREAVAMAQGAWLAGKKPVVYMQNSGLFESSNDIASLLIPSRANVLFVVSWRGAPGENATQHFVTGKSTKPLLEAFGMPFVEDPDTFKLTDLKTKMQTTNMPGAVLVKREKFNESTGETMPRKKRSVSDKTQEAYIEKGVGHTLNREQVLDLLSLSLITDEDAVFSSTGLISRSVFHHHDGPNQFYNAGAFGLTSSIALGFALSNKERKVFAIEGEGSVLTNLGAINIAGHYKPENLIHIVLDNGAYVSCSGEENYGSDKIPKIAKTFGYKRVFSVCTPTGLLTASDIINSEPSALQMLHIRIGSEGTRDLKRPVEMAEIAKRFRNHFNSE